MSETIVGTICWAMPVTVLAMVVKWGSPQSFGRQRLIEIE